MSDLDFVRGSLLSLLCFVGPEGHQSSATISFQTQAAAKSLKHVFMSTAVFVQEKNCRKVIESTADIVRCNITRH